jgi:hypothetical protein
MVRAAPTEPSKLIVGVEITSVIIITANPERGRFSNIPKIGATSIKGKPVTIQ